MQSMSNICAYDCLGASVYWLGPNKHLVRDIGDELCHIYTYTNRSGLLTDKIASLNASLGKGRN